MNTPTLEELALKYSNNQGGDCLNRRTVPGTPVGECIYIFCQCQIMDAYQAGWKAAEEHVRQDVLDEIHDWLWMGVGASVPCREIAQTFKTKFNYRRNRLKLKEAGDGK